MASEANNAIGRLGDAANRSKSKPDRYSRNAGIHCRKHHRWRRAAGPYGGMLLAVLELPPSEVQSKIELLYG